MALSNDCLQQHHRENVLTQRWAIFGVLSATGLHLVLLPFISWVPAQLGLSSETDSIQIMVTPTEPEPVPTELAEEVTEAASDSAEASPLPVPEQAEIAAVTNLVPERSESDTENPEAEDEPEPEEDPATMADTETEDELEESDGSNSLAEIDGETSTNDFLDQARNTLGQLFNNELGIGQNDQVAGDTDNNGTGDPSDDPVARAGPGTNPSGSGGNGEGNPGGNGGGGGPRTIACVSCSPPAYPESARQEGIEGTPRVRIQFDANGNVVGVTLERSSGNAALDQAALSSARSYQFSTGGQGGSVPLEMPFILDGSDRQRQVESQNDRREVTVPGSGTAASGEADGAITGDSESPSQDAAGDSATESSEGQADAPDDNSTDNDDTDVQSDVPSTDNSGADSEDDAPSDAPDTPQPATNTDSGSEGSSSETPTPAPSETPTPAPSETPTPAPSGTPTPTPDPPAAPPPTPAPDPPAAPPPTPSFPTPEPSDSGSAPVETE